MLRAGFPAMTVRSENDGANKARCSHHTVGRNVTAFQNSGTAAHPHVIADFYSLILITRFTLLVEDDVGVAVHNQTIPRKLNVAPEAKACQSRFGLRPQC